MNDTAFQLGGKDVEATLSATNGKEFVRIVYYESASAAKDAWEAAYEEFEKENDSDLIIKRSGKMIWSGTKAAIKAAK
ncbi:MAG: hypothetical protein E7585_05105 [Ruminococcaceae bacterium]|nr:hypothetical protein [Oscillospiraceae bacterium]